MEDYNKFDKEKREENKRIILKKENKCITIEMKTNYSLLSLITYKEDKERK